MARRQKQWAARVRAGLLEQLGGACVNCGTDRFLELHHTDHHRWTPSHLDPSARATEYRRAAARGDLVILCRACHGRVTRIAASNSGPPPGDLTPTI
jgi:5-methylcytosine-specific restriction endonuclease McrA